MEIIILFKTLGNLCFAFLILLGIGIWAVFSMILYTLVSFLKANKNFITTIKLNEKLQRFVKKPLELRNQLLSKQKL